MRALGIGEGTSRAKGAGVEYTIAALQAAQADRTTGSAGPMEVEGATPTPGTPKYLVPPPFDEASPGDCYFESSDDTRFKVLSSSLVHVSRYFEELFQNSLPSTSTTELPTFRFDEDARTLHALLIVLYPVHTQDFIDVQLVQKLTERQEKYDIPASTMMYAESVIVGRNSTSEAPTEDVLAVYAVAWRSGYRNEVQHFSRFTHRLDLTDQSIVDQLIHNSGSSKSYIALMELRRQREAALDDIIEALEPKKHFCPSHSSSDTMFFAFISMIKTAARNALLEPRPVCNDAFEFLGLQGTDERRTVTWCSSCYAKADKARLTNQLHAAVERYPQTTSIMPDVDFWGQWS